MVKARPLTAAELQLLRESVPGRGLYSVANQTAGLTQQFESLAYRGLVRKMRLDSGAKVWAITAAGRKAIN